MPYHNSIENPRLFDVVQAAKPEHFGRSAIEPDDLFVVSAIYAGRLICSGVRDMHHECDYKLVSRCEQIDLSKCTIRPWLLAHGFNPVLRNDEGGYCRNLPCDRFSLRLMPYSEDGEIKYAYGVRDIHGFCEYHKGLKSVDDIKVLMEALGYAKQE